jgi:pyruvate/2-oxoglutarate/acetoin dehydrogenase E1 component
VKISFAEGLAKAIYESVSSDPRVLLIGSGFMGLNPAARALLNPVLEQYSDRILVTPISELALAGAGAGAAMCGQRPLFFRHSHRWSTRLPTSTT